MSSPLIKTYMVATVKVPICVYEDKTFQYMNTSCVTTEIETYDVLPNYIPYPHTLPELVNDFFIELEKSSEPEPEPEQPPPTFVLQKRKQLHPSIHQTFRNMNHIKKQYTRRSYTK
jgi:hypothetical protein